MSIEIVAPVVCTFVSNTTYHCTLPPQSQVTNANLLVGTRVSVVMIATDTKSAVGVDVFVLRLSASVNLWDQITGWIVDNPIVAGAVVVAGIALSISCCILCYKQRKKALRK
jgi:hypothetical protein